MARRGGVFSTPAGFLLTSIVLAPLLVGGISWAFNSVGGGHVEPTASVEPTVQPTGEDENDITPTMIAGGTADQNKPFFDYVNKQTVALNDAPVGQTFVDALTAAGFDRAAMQLTPDTTAADLQADSIQFSVQIGEQCLIGQFGSGSKGYKSMLAPVVGGIGCLIGQTRPIDW